MPMGDLDYHEIEVTLTSCSKGSRLVGCDDVPMVRLDAVQKSYAMHEALRPTSLDVGRGEFLTLLGPSGSGKTTLLNMIAGMVDVTSGRIWIDGQDVTDLTPDKRGIGMVFQNYALMPHMTVAQNVAFPLQIRRVPKPEISRRVAHVLDAVRLGHLAGRKPKELSGGQQQRVSLARCIVYNPKLILMDEPLGALDKNLRDQMQLEIRRLHKELSITIVYVTHDQEEALTMSDRILLMNGGSIEQIGTPDELYFTPRSKFAAEFLGSSTLLPATRQDGRFAKLDCGTVAEVPRGVPTGTGHILVRPERLRLRHATEPTSGNVVRGVLRDTVVSGSLVRHFVVLADDLLVTIQELANEGRTEFKPGEDVSVTWPVEAGIFLAE